MRGPIRWFGGKGNFVKKLIPLLPPHHTYVEVFGGGASLLFAKEPSPVEVYNDIDSGLVSLFRVLRDPEKFEEFYRRVYLTPYSREEHGYCRLTWEKQEDELERAYRFYVACRQSFSGELINGSWGFSVTASRRNMAGTTSRWLSTIDNLPQIHERLKRVQIEHLDFRELVPYYDTENTLFYLDPPYIHETRRGGGYKHEMTLQDHQELVDLLLGIKGMAILSGYKHETYEPLEKAGWERQDFEVACWAVGRTRHTRLQGEGVVKEKQPRTESVWISPSALRHYPQATLFEKS